LEEKKYPTPTHLLILSHVREWRITNKKTEKILKSSKLEAKTILNFIYQSARRSFLVFKKNSKV
jgi:hypothetical protein